VLILSSLAVLRDSCNECASATWVVQSDSRGGHSLQKFNAHLGQSASAQALRHDGLPQAHLFCKLYEVRKLQLRPFVRRIVHQRTHLSLLHTRKPQQQGQTLSFWNLSASS
jgi:hypothetical protein